MLTAVLFACGESAEETSTKSEWDPEWDKVESDMFPYIETGLDYNTLDFQGKTVSYLYRGSGEDFYKYETYKDPVNDPDFDPNDKIDSAVFAKNEAVKSKLHIEFDFVSAGSPAHGMGALGVNEYFYKAEPGQYDIISSSNYGLTPIMLTGAFLNIRKLPYIDLTKGYWANGINDNATIHDTMFNVTGSISIFLYDALFVTFVNKMLCEDNKIPAPSLYQAVKDGKWTLDYVMKLTENIYDDTNRNSRRDLGDLYGFAMQVTSSTDAYLSSCNVRLTSKNDDGDLVFDPNTSRLNTVLKKLHAFTWEATGVVRIVEDSAYASEAAGRYTSIGSEQIAADHALFANDRLCEVKNADMKNCSYYGILPYPKLDEKQKQYHSMPHDAYTCLVVPLSAAGNSEVIGATLESLAEVSHNTVMPVYYEEVLTTRYAKDPDSVEMLNIIFQNVKMDSIYILTGMTASFIRWPIYDANPVNARRTIDEMRNTAERYCEQYSYRYIQYHENTRED